MQPRDKNNLQANIRKVLKDKLPAEISAAKSVEELVEEISIYHQELEYQNAELLEKQDQLLNKQHELQETLYELGRARKQSQSLFDDAPVPYLVMNEQYRITLVNGETSRLFGKSIENIVGTAFARWVEPESQDDLFLFFKNYKEKDEDDHSIVLGMTTPKGSRAMKMQCHSLWREGQLQFRVSLMDITREKETEQHLTGSLRNREERFRHITENMFDLVVLIDPEGRITYASRSVENLGYSESDLLERHILELVHPEDRPGAQRILEAAVKEKKGHYQLEFRCRCADSSYRWLEVIGKVMTDVDDNVAEMIFSGRDTTQRMETEDRLRAAKKEAESANLAKSQFLANMSHEIRTPMNGVIGFLQMLEETELNDQQKTYTDYIKTSADNLLHLLNDILDLSRIEAGKMTVEKHSFPLKETIEEAIVPLIQRAGVKKIQIVTRFQDDLPQWVIGDVNRFRQVLTNLVSNGVKFTHVGSVEIITSAVPDGDHRMMVNIEVKDTGIGIARENQNHLFQAFSQVDGSSTREFEGSGLGLKITRDLLHLMGGNISVDSCLNQGSCFTVTVPFECPDSGKQLPASKESPVTVTGHGHPKETSRSALVVEDHPMNQLLMVKMLEKLGFECQVADNGKEAVEKYQQQAFHLIMMDIQMPVMDGYEATRQIRKLTKIRQPKIVAMTAHAMLEVRDRCLAVGMDDYVSKPVHLENLKEMLFRGIRAVSKQ